jgi:hypothetical protein
MRLWGLARSKLDQELSNAQDDDDMEVAAVGAD